MSRYKYLIFLLSMTKKVELNDGYLYQAIFIIHSFLHFVHNKAVVSKLTLFVVFITCFSFKRLILLYMLYKRLRSLQIVYRQFNYTRTSSIL